MTIAPKTWLEVRDAYVRGEGSLRILADRFGLNVGTVERHAARENWSELRQRRDAAALATLVPEIPQPPVPVELPSFEVTAEWLEERQAAHFVENEDFIAKGRRELTKRLESPERLDSDALARLISAADALQNMEARLIGIRDRRKDKPAKRRSLPAPVPIQVEIGNGQPEQIVGAPASYSNGGDTRRPRDETSA